VESRGVTGKKIWFMPGINRRKTNKGSLWLEKTEQEKAAIIMAANETRMGREFVDLWELLKPEKREEYRARAAQFIAEGGSVRARAPRKRSRVI
jgi:hypothetical protein